MSTVISEQLFKEAKELFPGGVNSPVRAFKAVEGSTFIYEKRSWLPNMGSRWK